MNINVSTQQVQSPTPLERYDQASLGDVESFGIGTPPVEAFVELGDNNDSTGDDYSKDNAKRMIEAATDTGKDVYHIPGMSRAADSVKGSVIDLMV